MNSVLSLPACCGDPTSILPLILTQLLEVLSCSRHSGGGVERELPRNRHTQTPLAFFCDPPVSF